MGTRENKENTVWSEANAPVTPTHLLSRSQSSFLKNVKKSPQRSEAPRRPLASKDNNRAASFLSQKEQVRKKRTRPAVNHAGSFVGQTRPGHVPTLNTTGAPRLKSLVLKDAQEDGGFPEEQSEESDGVEDLELNPLAARLRGKLAAREGKSQLHQADRGGSGEDAHEGEMGLLGHLVGGGGGLKGLLSAKPELRPALAVSDSDGSDLEVETIPHRPEPLPYVPSGYTPFTDEAIAKLQSPTNLALRLTFSDEEHEEETENVLSKSGPSEPLQLLALDIENSEDEGDNDIHDRKRSHMPGLAPLRPSMSPAQDTDNNYAFELEPSYSGNGLTVKELEALLE
ncbi:LANO_0C06436g1_1 [Lachancea nothofagi CBS 11611]|uniref:LANO_0C06436g1_1 n=1 Tax=Lachancea nothofagi CBS 11611 TaxID=1266666 RepID=A0A1G4J7V3_9SACH|nr:LANO_0C06436g1_1 [Lachancea nothofagi CBS 11611]